MDLIDIPLINDLNEEESRVFYELLKASSLQDDSLDLSPIESLYLVDYEEIPVSIDTFLEDDYYLGKVYNNGSNIYPYWRNFLHNFFHNNPDNAFEVALTGAIGVGKTTIASIALMYLIYKTLCLKDPQKFYGLAANSPIVFVVMNLTLDLAYSGLYSLIVEAMRLSPWFCERVDIRGKYEFSISFPKNISLMAGSQTTHTIGKNVLGAVLDEVNFSNAPKGSKNSVMDMYRNIRRRLESRFLKQGRMPGILMMVSSKNTELDFLEQYVQSIKHLKTTWVVDEPVYNIKPPETYIGERFIVAVGDKTKESFIPTELDDLEEIANRGYNIIHVPVEYRAAFEGDINEALKDISGISAVSTSKLIPYAGRIDICFDSNRPSPFYCEQIELGLDSLDDIRDYLEDIRLLKVDLEKPRFAHIDIGLKGDRLGLAICHVSHSTTIDRYNINGAIEKVSENVYRIDLVLTIKALPGSEIPLFKVREFLIWLRSAIGYKFKKITFDGFQSADSIQLLKIAGFDTGLLSVDRSDVPYLNLRSCILEQRLECYYNSIAIEELRDLEYDRKAKKVDHPIVKADNSPGSKDTSDALCLSYDTQLFLLSGKSMTIEDLYESGLDNEWVLACDTENEQLVPVKIAKTIRKSHIPDTLIKITLDNGKSFKVTKDHLVLMRDSQYLEAGQLSVGDSLMPFNVYLDSDYKDYSYRKVVNPYTQENKFIYRIVRDTVLKEDFDAVDLSLDGGAYKIMHHIDMNKMNDNPDNLKPMSNKAHRKLHGDIFTRYNKSEKHTRDCQESSRENMQKIWNNPETVDKIKAAGSKTLTDYNRSQKHRDRLSDLWASGHYDHTLANLVEKGNTPEVKAKMTETKRVNGVLDQYAKAMAESNRDDVLNHKRKISKVQKEYEIVKANSTLFNNPLVTREMYTDEVYRLKQEGVISKHASSSSRYEDLIEAGVPISNHRIVSIEEVDNGCHYVYDLMLDTIHNFAIDAGVFVHNCGAVQNAQEYYAQKKGSKHIMQQNSVATALSAVQRINNLRKLQQDSMDDDSWIL